MTDKLKELESEIVYTRIMPNQLMTYRNAAFTCMLRQPGALLIEVARSRSYLSDPRRGGQRNVVTAPQHSQNAFWYRAGIQPLGMQSKRLKLLCLGHRSLTIKEQMHM